MGAQIFVSHSHEDATLAEALVEFILAATDISPDRIRCTSVPGHQIPFGRTVPDQLEADIHITSIVLVLLTQNSLRSGWVLFELGATWALGKVVVPILAHGLTVNDLPGPISNFPSVQVDSPDATSRLADAVVQIATALQVNPRSGGKREAKLRAFIECARSLRADEPQNMDVDQAMAFEIPWLILVILGGGAEYPDAIYPKIEFYLSKLALTPSRPIRACVRPGDDGREAMSLIAELGGSLAVRRADLVRAYEAGANLLPLAVHGKADEMKQAVQGIPLPTQLNMSRDNLREWIDEIHEYITRPLRRI